MKKIGILAIICFAILSMTYCCTAMAQDQPDSTHQIAPITTPEQAIARALAYTGFNKAEGYTSKSIKSVNKVVINDCISPFVASMVNEREVWSVQFKKVLIKWGAQSAKRNFRVLLDPETGRLLEIYSIAKGVGSSDTLPLPSATEAESFLKKCGTNFAGLPDQTPKANCLQALSAGMTDPCRTAVIRATYINHKSGRQAYNNTWVLLMHGSLSVLPISYPSLGKKYKPAPTPMNEQNSLWNVIDGITGRWLYTTDSPIDVVKLKREKGK